MVTTKKPKLIIFDLDDTLVSATTIYDIALQKIGLATDDTLFLKARQDTKASLPVGSPASRSRFLYLKRFLELSGIYRPRIHLDLAEAYELSVVEQMAVQWQELARSEFFQKLKQKDLKLAVLSNESCRFQTRKLAAFEGATSLFDHLLTSEERGFEKPNTILFTDMLKYFDMAPSQALMVGDSFDHDIQPCLDLKIPCVQTREFVATTQVHTQSIKNLIEILDFV